MKGNLICVIGIDGSGKTTMISNLIKLMRESGLNVEYKWMKFESIPLKFALTIKNKFIIKETNFSINYTRSTTLRSYFHKNPVIKRVYRYYMYVSYFLQLQLKISQPLRKGINIICDRYIYDTLLDYSFMFNEENEVMIKRINFFKKLVPKPNIIFYVKVHPKIAIMRKDDIPSLSFLQVKYSAYQEIVESNNAHILDGTKPRGNLMQEAFDIVSKSITIPCIKQT